MAKLLALGISLAIAFGFLECGTRILYGDSIVMFPRYHTSVDYGEYKIRHMRPNSKFKHRSVEGEWNFIINSQGYRNLEDFSYKNPQNAYRIIALGDSHTQGYEVDQNETYASVLESVLESAGLDAEVYNVGVSGYSNAEALIFLEQEGSRYKPDAVVLGFFSNDYVDNVTADLFGVENDVLITRNTEHIPGVGIQNLIYGIPATQWLSENSYFYSLLFNRVWVLTKSIFRQVRKGTVSDEEFAVATKSSTTPYEDQLARLLLERMARYCDENNILFIVVDIPLPKPDGSAGSSIQPSLSAEVDRIADYVVHAPKTFEPFRPPEDLGPFGPSHARPYPFHRTYGHRHINPLAHRIIAEQLARFIGERIESPQRSISAAP